MALEAWCAAGAASGAWLSRRFGYRALLRPTRFDGRGLIHFTVPNRSSRTRVSLDFRCVPDHAYDASARLARFGYYSRADRVGLESDRSESGEWKTACARRLQGTVTCHPCATSPGD